MEYLSDGVHLITTDSGNADRRGNIIKNLFSATTNLGLTARNAGKLFVAGEDDTGQGQGRHPG